jgi:hypothetical protein
VFLPAAFCKQYGGLRRLLYYQGLLGGLDGFGGQYITSRLPGRAKWSSASRTLPASDADVGGSQLWLLSWMLAIGGLLIPNMLVTFVLRRCSRRRRNFIIDSFCDRDVFLSTECGSSSRLKNRISNLRVV